MYRFLFMPVAAGRMVRVEARHNGVSTVRRFIEYSFKGGLVHGDKEIENAIVGKCMALAADTRSIAAAVTTA